MRSTRPRLRLAKLLVFTIPIMVGACSTDDDTARAAGSAIPGIVREVQPSVVTVLTDTGEGSGVVWAADGTIVTNDHVAGSAAEIHVAFADGTRVRARVVATDPITDLAVLRAERDGLPAAQFADDLPEVGELAIAIGNPLGFEQTVTAGIVSGLHRAIPGSAASTQALVDLIQTDAPISPGNSGGALVDRSGRIIGINVAYIPPQASAVSIGFAIPAPTVRNVVEQLLEDGTANHAFLGVQPAPLTPQIADRLQVRVDAGVVILDVVPDGPADQAGVRPGDVVTMVGDQRVATVEALLAALRRHDPGQSLRIVVARGAETATLDVNVANRPTT